jgi:hypothetical protein
MRVDSHSRKSEFGHVGLADDGGARIAQTFHHRRVRFGGGSAFQCHRTGQGRFSFDIKQILHRHGQAR